MARLPEKAPAAGARAAVALAVAADAAAVVAVAFAALFLAEGPLVAVEIAHSQTPLLLGGPAVLIAGHNENERPVLVMVAAPRAPLAGILVTSALDDSERPDAVNEIEPHNGLGKMLTEMHGHGRKARHGDRGAAVVWVVTDGKTAYFCMR